MAGASAQAIECLDPTLREVHRFISEWAEMKGWRMWTMLDHEDWVAVQKEAGWTLTSGTLGATAEAYRRRFSGRRAFAMTFWQTHNRESRSCNVVMNGLDRIRGQLEIRWPPAVIGYHLLDGVQIWVWNKR